MAQNEKLSPEAMKKKITIGVFAVVVVVILWQVIGMFGGDKSAAVAPSPAPAGKAGATPAAASPAAPAGAAPAAASPASSGAATPAAQSGPVAPHEEVIKANAELMKLQKETEAKYLAAMNELQILKVQREIAEANEAISESKLKTVKTEKSITSLLTIKPAQVEEGAYASMLGGKKPVSAPQPATVQQQQQVATTPAVAYVVLSVSQQDNKWSAVLGHSGKLYSIAVGDTLSADGSTVNTISKDGVVLEKNGIQKKIPISSAIQ